jgi:hypothetical protein
MALGPVRAAPGGPVDPQVGAGIMAPPPRGPWQPPPQGPWGTQSPDEVRVKRQSSLSAVLGRTPNPDGIN